MKKTKKRKYQISFTMYAESETVEKGKKSILEIFKMIPLNIKLNGIKVVHGKRTLQQNRAMWLWATQLAEMFNEKGIDMRAFLRPAVEISWTKNMVIEYIWKPLLKLSTGKDSTTDMSNFGDIDYIMDNSIRIITERTRGEVIPPPFPCEEFRQWELENKK